ncbi:MAG TPA: hypothetical protein VE890_02260 [Thermoguttaceae bacterium]|nr:hypothetical protein [Thermoguttaceae bacterium]
MSRRRRRRSLVRNPLSPLEPRFSPASVILDDMLDLFELDDVTTEPHPEIGDFLTPTSRREFER